MSESYKILVDLDALLDTRLATLASIDVELANTVGQSEAYYHRFTDKLSLIDERIDDDLFGDRYLKRQEGILDYALATDVVHLISMGLNDMMPNVYRGIVPKDVRLIVNTYPYRIPQSRRDSLQAAILHHIPYEVTVEMVHIGTPNLTPATLGGTYDEWYVYNIEPWLAMHTNALLTRPVTKMNIILPKLSTSGNDPQAESFDVEPFKARELLFKPYMNLNYVDLKFFSYNHAFALHLKEKGWHR